MNEISGACGVQVVVSSVWYAVGYQGLRLRRVTGWRLRENPLVTGKGPRKSDGKPLSASGFCFFQLLSSRF